MLLVGLLNGCVLLSVEAQRGGACHGRRAAEKRRLRQCILRPMELMQAEEARHKSSGRRAKQKDFNKNAVPNEGTFVDKALARHFF